jgi:transposase
MQVTTVGLDLAKRVFQVHGVDAVGQVIVRRKLQRAQVANFFAGLPPCLVGIEACATAHHWARLIGASGHQVRLIPPSYVKPMFGVARPTLRTLRRSARRLGDRACGLCR